MFKPLKSKMSLEQSIDLIWLSLGSVALVEFAAHAAPGAIVLDLQHGLWERGTLEAAIAAAGSDVPVIARCAENSPHAIAQPLDAGAASVLVPLVETEADARQAVAAGRYPPLGRRSAGGVRPLLAGVEAMLEADRQVAVGVLIETVRGVENAAAIAAVPGVDYLFVGTGDLALSRGTGDLEVIARDCAHVLRAAREAGLPCGVFTQDAAAARTALANGYRLAVAANDIDVAKQGFLAARRALA